jgi:BolA protein
MECYLLGTCDFTRCGVRFSIEIVSVQFEGKKLLEQHRMVNSALAEDLKKNSCPFHKEGSHSTAVQIQEVPPANK